MHYIKSLISFTISIFFALSLFSYNNSDPSFNRATNVLPENLMGLSGAYISEPLLQLFGLTSFLFILIPLCWSFVFYYHGRVTIWFSRILAGIIALNAGSLVFQFLSIKNQYFSCGGGGGNRYFME